MLDSRYRLKNDLVIVIVKNMDQRTGFAWNGGLGNGWTHVLIRSDFMFQRIRVAHEVAKIFGVYLYTSAWSRKWSNILAEQALEVTVRR